MTGTGGFLKIRFALKGSGKSGGRPRHLLLLRRWDSGFLGADLCKERKVNVSGAEKIALAKMAGQIKRNYGR